MHADQLRDQIALALKTVSWLVINGIKPLSQDAGSGPKPKIMIEASNKCVNIRRRYGAEIVCRSQNRLGVFQHWQANVDGCLVEWKESI